MQKGDGEMSGKEIDLTGERTIRYVLLNKDVEIAEFEVDTLYDDITIIKQFVKLPEWFGNLDSFIINRRAPKQRENIEELLRLS